MRLRSRFLLSSTIGVALIAAVPFASSCVYPAAAAYVAPMSDAPLFYDELAPYGRWWQYGGYGWVFSPYVDVGWRPYSVGRWAWTTDYGWLWNSADPFGGPVHHYGSWLFVNSAGWTWIPGDVWAPAWVAWRTGPGLIGWGALGPTTAAYVSLGGWVFVDESRFLVPNVATVAHSVGYARTVLPSTRVIHRPERASDGRIVNRGVDVERVERVTKQRLPRAQARALAPVPRAVDPRAAERLDASRVRSDPRVTSEPRVKSDPRVQSDPRVRTDARQEHARDVARQHAMERARDINRERVLDQSIQRSQMQRMESARLKSAPPQRSAPQRVAPQRSAPQRVAPQRSAPPRVAPQRSAPQRVAPHHSAPPRSAPHHSAPPKSGPRK